MRLTTYPAMLSVCAVVRLLQRSLPDEISSLRGVYLCSGFTAPAETAHLRWSEEIAALVVLRLEERRLEHLAPVLHGWVAPASFEAPAAAVVLLRKRFSLYESIERMPQLMSPSGGLTEAEIVCVKLFQRMRRAHEGRFDAQAGAHGSPVSLHSS